MKNTTTFDQNVNDLDTDQTNIILMFLHQELVRLEGLCDIEMDFENLQVLFAKQDELQALYQSEIQRSRELDPYK